MSSQNASNYHSDTCVTSPGFAPLLRSWEWDPYPEESNPDLATDPSQVNAGKSKSYRRKPAPTSVEPSSRDTPPSETDLARDDPTTSTEDEDLQRYRSAESVIPGEREPAIYDLSFPPPSSSLARMEYISERLLSEDHLRLILQSRIYLGRFSNFLSTYDPASAKVLHELLELQKALSAIDYANAISNNVDHGLKAAISDEPFKARTKSAIEKLLSEPLPSYIAHRLVWLVTDTLVKEITMQNTPLMRDLVRGLGDTYCISSADLPDQPIIYASEGFLKCTMYSKDYIIGKNCRFLQGPGTHQSSRRRIGAALKQHSEICEVILNYRRDGSPFFNLVSITPLLDNAGHPRYFLGAQVDINGLIENGAGLGSLKALLTKDRSQEKSRNKPVSSNQALAELSMLLSRVELENVRNNGRWSIEQDGNCIGQFAPRRYVGVDDPIDAYRLWPDASLGKSGRLPGVFKNWVLVRPYPSLKIVFTSAALRIPGLLLSKLDEHIGGPQRDKDEIIAALSGAIKVTARVTWLPGADERPLSYQPQSSAKGLELQRSSQKNDNGSVSPEGDSGSTGTSSISPSAEGEGRSTRLRWIHCTPLIGSDDNVGVWMVIMVEPEEITGNINIAEKARHKLEADSQVGLNLIPSKLQNRREQLYRDFSVRKDPGPSVNAQQHMTSIPHVSTNERPTWKVERAPRSGVSNSQRHQQDYRQNEQDISPTSEPISPSQVSTMALETHPKTALPSSVASHISTYSPNKSKSQSNASGRKTSNVARFRPRDSMSPAAKGKSTGNMEASK